MLGDPSATNAARLAVVVAFIFLPTSGCGRSSTLDAAGLLGLDPGADWKAVPADRWPVPGRPFAAWEGPEGASMVVYSTIAAPGTTPEALAIELATRLENLPGLQLVSHRVGRVGGAPAVWLDVVAIGTGDALAPSGLGVPVGLPSRPLIPTRRITLGIPRPASILWIVWHGPERESGRLGTEAERMAGRLVLRGPAEPSSNY